MKRDTRLRLETNADGNFFVDSSCIDCDACRQIARERLLHAADVSPDTADVEVKPGSNAPVWIRDRLLMIPTPGHTRGHAVFLYDETFLFTGDHLAWNAEEARLYAFRGACWYSWKEQIHSMERLLEYRFEWILPGHGRPVRLPAETMHEQLPAFRVPRPSSAAFDFSFALPVTYSIQEKGRARTPAVHERLSAAQTPRSLCGVDEERRLTGDSVHAPKARTGA